MMARIAGNCGRRLWRSSVATAALLSSSNGSLLFLSLRTNDTTSAFVQTNPCQSRRYATTTPTEIVCGSKKYRAMQMFSTRSDSEMRPASPQQNNEQMDEDGDGDGWWSDILPFSDGSHRSACIEIPSFDDDLGETAATAFDASNFGEHLESTVTACRELGKSSVWIECPMNRCSLIETGKMQKLGFHFHHAIGDKAVLNLWLKDTESKVPEYSTHNVGVGAVVVNSRDEILCVRELRKNYLPWKTPTGLSELGEHIDDAAVREVLEETGIRTKFHSILSFRQTHGLAHGRSDLFFVCRLDPIEDEIDQEGNVIIAEPTAQVCEIETAQWIPLLEYRAMINDPERGHPMMRHAIELYDAGKRIEKNLVDSVIPGRGPNAVYFPNIKE